MFSILSAEQDKTLGAGVPRGIRERGRFVASRANLNVLTALQKEGAKGQERGRLDHGASKIMCDRHCLGQARREGREASWTWGRAASSVDWPLVGVMATLRSCGCQHTPPSALCRSTLRGRPGWMWGDLGAHAEVGTWGGQGAESFPGREMGDLGSPCCRGKPKFKFCFHE